MKETLWQVPHGDTPDNVRNHPALKGLNIPKTGQNGNVGLVVTGTLVILGDPLFTNDTGTSARRDAARVRQADGHRSRAVYMPAPQSGSSMTCMGDGKQYIVVAVSGGNYSGEYLAYSLPNER